MKRCPRCGKAYDDSWSVCLKDNAALVYVAGKETETDGKAAESGIKRPVGVVVIAVLLLLSGLFGSLSIATLVMPKQYSQFDIGQLKNEALKLNPNMPAAERARLEAMEAQPAVQEMIKVQKEYLGSGGYKAMSLISGIIGIISIVAGAGLLMLREWARKLAIALQLLAIPVFVISMFMISGAFNALTANMPQGAQAFSVMVTMQALLGAAVISAIVYYLSRPQVRKRFA